MPVKKKKKFIDKKNAVTFHLVHRSQRDPLQAAEDAPKHVLLPADVPENERNEVRKEEQKKFGVDYDDEYDYLQHLRDVNEINEVGPGAEVYRIPATKKKEKKKEGIQLSSKLFASELETEVGLLNKAVPVVGPQPDWDPDIVAALDDDFDFSDPENQLDDDFMQTANSEATDPSHSAAGTSHSGGMLERLGYSKPQEETVKEEEDGEWEDEEDVASDEAEDDFSDGGSLGSFGEVETKSHFTNYSMTSSVMRRNQGLTLLDDRFEKLFAQYDDSEMGALEHEDIAGTASAKSALLNNVLEEFEVEHAQVTLKDVVKAAEDVAAEDFEVEEETDSDTEVVAVDPAKAEPEKRWDCESILSTYSNLYNHPKKITEPKTGRPKKKVQLPPEELEPAEESDEGEEYIPASTHRPKSETAEERRARKQAVKDERKTRRQEKKQNKTAFKSEEIRQNKERLNLAKNTAGLKIS